MNSVSHDPPSTSREVIAKLNSPHPYTVDLRGLSNIEGVFFATMGTLGKHVKDYKLHLLLDAIKDLIHGMSFVYTHKNCILICVQVKCNSL